MQADMSGFTDALMSFKFRWGVGTVWAFYRPNLSSGPRSTELTVRKMLIIKLPCAEFCAILNQIVSMLKSDPVKLDIFFWFKVKM